MAKSIMIQGTMSNAGKSLFAAALCRIFRQDGYSVAPFKSQNMALNSYITADGLEMLKQKSVITIPSLTTRRAVTSFAGIRAHTDREENDFIIGPSEKNGKFINVAGIESPGLTSAPAIGEYVCKMLVELTGATPNKNFNPHRKAPIRFREMSIEERKELIAKDKRYGRIICRCETVTEGEIMDAIHSTIGAVDMDGVKRRTRAGMGRCQSGFCGIFCTDLCDIFCGGILFHGESFHDI